jgi:hypothetical protein
MTFVRLVSLTANFVQIRAKLVCLTIQLRCLIVFADQSSSPDATALLLLPLILWLVSSIIKQSWCYAILFPFHIAHPDHFNMEGIAQNSAPTFSDVPYEKRWELLKPYMEQLYIQEKQKLPDLVAIMKTRHKFYAS